MIEAEIEVDIGVAKVHCVYDTATKELLSVSFREGGEDLAEMLDTEILGVIREALDGVEPDEPLEKPTAGAKVIPFPVKAVAHD